LLRFAVDENVDARIIHGVVLRIPGLDITFVQRSGLAATDDRVILQWAADTDRVLITHDVSTMVSWAYERVEAGQTMPGLAVIASTLPIGQAVDALCFLAQVAGTEDCIDQVLFLPI
jgi:hypothetical protein